MQVVTASARAVRPFEAFHRGAEGQRRHGFGAFVAALVLAVACVAASAKKHSLATAALQQSRVQSSLAAANEKIQDDYLRYIAAPRHDSQLFYLCCLLDVTACTVSADIFAASGNVCAHLPGWRF